MLPHLSIARGIFSANAAQEVRDNYRSMAKPAKKPSSAKEILARIDQRIAAMKAAGLKRTTDRAISLLAGGSTDTLRSMRRAVEKGLQTGVSSETLHKLAPVLGTSARWLLTGDGVEDIDQVGDHLDSEAVLPEVPTSDGSVALIGFVSAGSEAKLIPLPDEELDRVPSPPGATPSTRALEIRGISLGELFDRWLVFYDDVRSPVTPNMIGKLCVVGLPDGRILVKKLRRSSANGHFDLLSNTEPPLENMLVEWAALVTSMGPR